MLGNIQGEATYHNFLSLLEPASNIEDHFLHE